MRRVLTGDQLATNRPRAGGWVCPTAAARSAVALRAGVSASVAVLVAVGAHAAAGGEVDVATAGWALAALSAPAAWLARRERGWLVLAGGQLVGQQVAHVALTASPDANGTVSHQLSGQVPADLMLYAHLVAAALAAVWLRIGERRVFGAIQGVVDVCRMLTTAGPPVYSQSTTSGYGARPG